MNQKNAREYLPLVEALADGELQVKGIDGVWNDAGYVDFTLPPDQYRRKPKPQKLYVATWFNKEGAICSFGSRDKDTAMNWSGENGFKLHELDCGVAE